MVNSHIFQRTTTQSGLGWVFKILSTCYYRSDGSQPLGSVAPRDYWYDLLFFDKDGRVVK